MKRLLLALALAFPLFAGDSLVLTTSDAFQFDPPNNATWQNITQARRIEVGLDVTNWNCGVNSASDVIEFGTRLQLGCAGNEPTNEANYLCVRTAEANNARQACVDIVTGNGNVIVVRAQLDGEQSAIQRSAGSARIYIETWDVDGTSYQYDDAGDPDTNFATTEDASAVQVLGGAQTTAKVLWAKLYSTVVEPGVSAPLPNPHGTGDMGDWDFDGNTLADSSGAGMTLVNTAGATNYEATPSINPAPYLSGAVSENWIDAPTVRAGAEVTLTGTCSSYADVDGCTCVWSDQGGGTSGTDEILFTGSTTTCTTTAVFPTFGSYTLRLVATDDDANAGTRDFEIGAVAQDSTSHVVYPSANIEYIVGPQLAFGNSAWPWFDNRRQTIGNWMGERIPDPAAIGTNTVDWGQTGAGTVSVTNGSATITGTGTDFQNDYCGGDTTNDSTWGIIVIDDAGLYWRIPITSCNSATSLTVSNNWNRASDSGLAYLKAVDYGDWTAGTGSEAQNFYDNCLAYGAMYYATGLSRWLDWHNTCGSIWWEFPMINKGQCREGPLAGTQCAYQNTGMMSLAGLMLWTEINGTQSTVWDGIEEILAYHYGTWGNRTTPSNDIRPSGYALSWVALGAGLDPDAGRSAAYEADLDVMLGDLFSLDQQHPDGAWYHASNNRITGTGTVSVTNGSPTVTCDGTCNFSDGSVTTTLTAAITSTTSTSAISVTSTTGFPSAGQIQIDSEIIRYTGTTGTTFTGITRSAGMPNTGATHSNGATVSIINHEGRYFNAYANSLDSWDVNGRRGDYLISSVDSATQITLASNFTGTTGTGLTWESATLNSKLMQPFIQAMPMSGFAWIHESGYSDERQKAIDALNYNRTRGYRSHTGGYYVIMDDGGCKASIDAGTTLSVFDCQFTNNAGTTDFSGSRYLLQEPSGASAMAAKYARDLSDPNATALATHVDVIHGHAFGKWGGPQSDYNESTCSTCFAQELDDGQTTFSSTKNKNWGFGFGFGRGYIWDALRDGDPAAESLTDYTVPLDIAGVSMATKASVTLYEPKGTVSRVVNNQTGTSAAVTGDSRQGDHLAKIEYKDSMDVVLQTDWVMASEAAVEPALTVTGSATISGAVSF